MRHLTRPLCSLAVLSLTALQFSCSDSSGPGHVATTLEPNSSTTITSAPGVPVTELPSVIVRDADGAPMSGATVTFSVTSGGGSVTGGTQVTNSAGIATVGSWTLGSVSGVNTLTATSGSLTPVTFTANSVDPCVTSAPHTFGTTTNGTLSTSDCRLSDGSFVDFFTTTLAAGTFLLEQTSNFDAFLVLLTPEGTLVGFNDDIVSGTNTNSRIKVLVPAGNYQLAATSFDPNTVGAYTVSSASTTAEVTNCEDVFVMKGITTAQSLQATDCTTSGPSDQYLIFLTAGQSLTVTMSSATVDSYLELFLPGGTSVSNDNATAGSSDAQISHTATATGFFGIRARSAVVGSTGAYNLVLQ